jgi:hypothetical protein
MSSRAKLAVGLAVWGPTIVLAIRCTARFVPRASREGHAPAYEHDAG